MAIDIKKMLEAQYNALMNVLENGDMEEQLKAFSSANTFLKNIKAFEEDDEDIALTIAELPTFTKETLSREVKESTNYISDEDLKGILNGEEE